LWVGMVQFHGQTQLFNLFQCQNGRRVVHGPQIPNDQMENRTRTRPWPHLTNARWPGSLCFSVFSAFFSPFRPGQKELAGFVTATACRPVWLSSLAVFGMYSPPNALEFLNNMPENCRKRAIRFKKTHLIF